MSSTATAKQIDYLKALVGSLSADNTPVPLDVRKASGGGYRNLTRAQASAMIDTLKGLA